MSPRPRCPQCGGPLIDGRWDATFRMPDRSERQLFGIPAGLCEECAQLRIDREIFELLDLAGGRCVFAIESDHVAQERARAAR
jgi:hypothetical protein